jgi:hypothetical protein
MTWKNKDEKIKPKSLSTPARKSCPSLVTDHTQCSDLPEPRSKGHKIGCKGHNVQKIKDLRLWNSRGDGLSYCSLISETLSVFSTQGAKGICNPIGGTTLWTNQYPWALDSSCICINRWPSRPSLEREAHWTRRLCVPRYRGTPGPKGGSGWVGEWGWVGKGDFWYNIGNVNELNT